MQNGFLLKHRNFDVGSSDFPNTTTLAAITEKEQKLVKAVAEMLIESNLGWELDYTRNLTINDFVDCPNIGKLGAGTTVANYKSPSLFLKNTISGCKLFVSYLCSCSYGGFAIFDENNNIVFDNNMVVNFLRNGYTTRTCGFIMSMIPPSDETFGLNFDSSFLPPHATRIIGTISQESNSNHGNSTAQYVCFPNSKGSYSLGVYLWIRSDCIGVGYKYNNYLEPRYFVGNILSYLANSEDTNFYSTYGVFPIRNSYYQNYNVTNCNELNYTVVNQSSDNYSGASKLTAFGTGSDFLKISQASSMGVDPRGSGFCFSANGNCLNGCTVLYFVAFYAFQELLRNPELFVSSGNFYSWMPIAMFIVTNAIQTYGITETNGFKGFLNTDLFRSTSCTIYEAKLEDGFIAFNWGLAIRSYEE